MMLPPVQYHIFETRMVKTTEGIGLYRLSRDVDGKYYFISHQAIWVYGNTLGDLLSIANDIISASHKPILDAKDIY